MEHTSIKVRGQPDRNKKLINLSKLVLEKVQNTKTTTGNMIAKEILRDNKGCSQQWEFKNIQRRVYDALNVLHAIDFITKIRNEVKYKGPVDKLDMETKVQQIRWHKFNIEWKRRKFTESLIHILTLNSLCKRNMENHVGGIQLPLIFVKSNDAIKVQIEQDSIVMYGKQPIIIKNDTQLLSEMELQQYYQKFNHLGDWGLQQILWNLYNRNDCDFVRDIVQSIIRNGSTTSEDESQGNTAEPLNYKELYLQLKKLNNC